MDKRYQFCPQTFEVHFAGGTARVQHNVHAWWQQAPRCPQNLSNPSLDAVSLVCRSKLARRGQAKPAVLQTIGYREDNKGAR